MTFYEAQQQAAGSLEILSYYGSQNIQKQVTKLKDAIQVMVEENRRLNREAFTKDRTVEVDCRQKGIEHAIDVLAESIGLRSSLY